MQFDGKEVLITRGSRARLERSLCKMPNLQAAYDFCVTKCNAANVGYSKTLRRGKVVDGIEHYDCSSLMSASLYAGGFFKTNPWFSTMYEQGYLEKAGFTRLDASVDWLPGDILWRSGHTEMVYKGSVTMGAHTATVALANQVSINAHATAHSKWTYCYRYNAEVTPGEGDEPEEGDDPEDGGDGLPGNYHYWGAARDWYRRIGIHE